MSILLFLSDCSVKVTNFIKVSDLISLHNSKIYSKLVREKDQELLLQVAKISDLTRLVLHLL